MVGGGGVVDADVSAEADTAVGAGAGAGAVTMGTGVGICTDIFSVTQRADFRLQLAEVSKVPLDSAP